MKNKVRSSIRKLFLLASATLCLQEYTKFQGCHYFLLPRVDGVDFSYSSSTVSSGEGRTCAQFKMGGNVRITSPFSQNAKLVAGNPVSGSSCPLEYDTLVLRPPGQAQMGQCEEVVVVLRGNTTHSFKNE